MDTNSLPPLPGLERISSSCSTSSICTTSTMSSSADTILSDEHASNLDYQLSFSESTSTGATKRRKRQNSTMIIKPTRWSPPLCQNQHPQSQHHHQQQHRSPPDTNRAWNEKNGTTSSNNISAIDTDFKPTFYNPNEIKHRRRISTHQCSVLEEEYHTNSKPSASKRHQLAEQLDMTPRTVQIWFQNKRAKAKQHQQQQHQQKNKPALSPTCHHATPPTSSIPSTKSETTTTPPSSSSTTAMPLDMFTFDDGRLDPIYLMNDHSVAATLPPSSVSSSPPVTKCGTMLPLNEGDHDVAAVVVPMTGVYDTSTMGDHGTMELAPAAAPISSPLLPSSETTGTGTCDTLTMWPYSNDSHPLPSQDLFSSTTTSSSSTPLQPFSTLDIFSALQQPFQQQQRQQSHDMGEQYKNMINASSVSSLYAMAKQQVDSQQHQQQQQQPHYHDCSFSHPWTQKSPTDPGFGTSMVSTWPYMMNQHAIQNDYLDFVLDQDDWMGPFYASA